jgi:hypothetical protein
MGIYRENVFFRGHGEHHARELKSVQNIFSTLGGFSLSEPIVLERPLRSLQQNHVQQFTKDTVKHGAKSTCGVHKFKKQTIYGSTNSSWNYAYPLI